MTRYELLTPQTHFDAVILANGTFPTHALPLGLLHQAKHVFCCDGAITELSRHTDIVPDAIVATATRYRRRCGRAMPPSYIM